MLHIWLFIYIRYRAYDICLLTVWYLSFNVRLVRWRAIVYIMSTFYTITLPMRIAYIHVIQCYITSLYLNMSLRHVLWYRWIRSPVAVRVCVCCVCEPRLTRLRVVSVEYHKAFHLIREFFDLYRGLKVINFKCILLVTMAYVLKSSRFVIV